MTTCGTDRTPDQLITKHTKFHADIWICKDERFCAIPDVIHEGRNYERRAIPELPDWTVTRDGDLQFKGRDEYKGVLTDSNGTRMTVQMFIHKAFPDIPMRETPKW
jgi:hypothetical protein